MISEAVVAAYEKAIDDGYHRGQLTVTGVSPCPFETYINYHHLDPQVTDAYGRLRMKNGHWQELEVLEDLRVAGFKLRHTGTDQLIVTVGPVKGRPDGLITVDGREDLLEIKAMSLDSYTKLKGKGLAKSHPRYKSQVQLYMHSEELIDKVNGCWLYAKHKDSCRPYDVYEEKDSVYTKPIIEALDAIVLGKEKVKRPDSPNELCTSCRHSNFCWKEVLLNTSEIKVVDLPEVVTKWKEGKYHQEYGKSLIEEAREVFEYHLGDNELLLVNGLRIKRIVSKRTDIDITKFCDIFGANRLAEVMTEKMVSQMRITSVLE